MEKPKPPAAKDTAKEQEPKEPLGQWLVKNMPRGIDLELPDRHNESKREIPFAEYAETDDE